MTPSVRAACFSPVSHRVSGGSAAAPARGRRPRPHDPAPRSPLGIRLGRAPGPPDRARGRCRHRPRRRPLLLFLLQGLRRRPWARAYNDLRSDLGRGILIGLELLVGADIITTITAPLTFASVGLLAAIVAIRTFLSFSLETEIEGRWPWRRADAGAGRDGPGTAE